MTKATLEDVYAAVADGIDAAGPAREALFLSKVVLLLADALDDPDAALALVREGLDGLEGMSTSNSGTTGRPAGAPARGVGEEA